MIPAHTLTPREPVYTFIERGTGRNITIATRPLREWLAAPGPALIEQGDTPIDRDFALSFFRDNIVSRARITELMAHHASHPNHTFDPIIYGHRGTYTNNAPDVMLIDGHHRYVIAALTRHTSIPAYLLTVAQWQQFEVIGLPDITEAQLRNTPIIPRNYF